MKLALSINGARVEVETSPSARLLDVLRGPLGLTGAKEGCGEGECGACTVLLDGDPVNACLVLVGQCEGREITSVEGLAKGGCLTHLQRAFVEEGGAQCGICTPGMLLSAQAYEASSKSLVTLREAIAGNICRCTGYQRIVESIVAAEEHSRAKSSGRVGG